MVIDQTEIIASSFIHSL